MASVLTWSSDPNVVIPPTIAGAVEILKSAMKEDSVKSFVFTSSSWSASMPRPNVEITITKDTWNEESSVIAWGDNPDGANVYGARYVCFLYFFFFFFLLLMHFRITS